MGQAVDRLLGHLNAPRRDTVEAIFERWPELVGDVIGTHTTPMRVVDGELHLEVADQAWVSEMEWMSEELLRQITTKLETDEIQAIKVHLARSPQ